MWTSPKPSPTVCDLPRHGVPNPLRRAGRPGAKESLTKTPTNPGNHEWVGDETFTRRVAVVTGGNRGIGLEICRQLSRLGLRVVLTAHDETSAKAAASGLDCRGPGLVVGTALDVRDEDSVASTSAEIARSHG